ncbi:MAG: DNA-formamidopyrimidine glycosylase [Firmicutes bacterium]|nr:DNA-formamidopyrimidine glycosylase [Bacillota bacterium]
MPELPEVETIRLTIMPEVVNKTIKEVSFFYPRILPKNTPEEFIENVQNRKIVDIKRRGKYLLFELDSEQLIIMHLRMTGRLLTYKSTEAEATIEKHTSVIFTFTDNSQLRFVDQRKFGTIYLIAPENISIIAGLKDIGPEPLSGDFSLPYLKKILDSNRTIKSLLLDQKLIAGIGNIYADEILFRSRIHPTRTGKSITLQEQELLHKAAQEVLKEALLHEGTTIRDYLTGSGMKGNFQNRLRVYGKTGEKCVNCDSLVERIKVAGRSTHYCPSCQRSDEL